MIFIGLRKFLSYFIPKVVLVAVTRWLGIGDGGAFSNLLIKQEINSLVFMLIG